MLCRRLLVDLAPEISYGISLYVCVSSNFHQGMDAMVNAIKLPIPPNFKQFSMYSFIVKCDMKVRKKNQDIGDYK